MSRGTDRPGPNLRFATVCVDGSLDRGLHDPRAEWDRGRLEFFGRRKELDVVEALRLQVLPQLRELLLLLHVRDGTKINLRPCDGGVHGVRLLFNVPADESTNRAGWGVYKVLHDFEIVVPSDEFLDAPESFERLRGKDARLQEAQFARGRTSRVFIPARDLDPPLRIAEAHEGVHQPPGRVRRDRRV